MNSHESRSTRRWLWHVRRALAVSAALMVIASGRPSHASFAGETPPPGATVAQCYFCAWEVCGTDRQHWDMSGYSFSESEHDSCQSEDACSEHKQDCSETLKAPEERELDAALDDETGLEVVRLITEYPEAARVNIVREALQVMGCSGMVEEHHQLTARQVAAVERFSVSRVAVD